MSRSRRRAPLLVVLAVLPSVSLVACSDDQPGTRITVHTDAETCGLSRDTAEGPITFWVVNDGEARVDVALHDADGDVVAELDDIEPAMIQPMAANVYEGEYELECRPAQGEVMRSSVTVG